MKRPIRADHAAAFALTLAAAASADAVVPPSSRHAASSSASTRSTWRPFEAAAVAPAASVGRHQYRRRYDHHRFGRSDRRYGSMHVEEEEDDEKGGDETRNQNGLAGAVGGLLDNLRRRPTKKRDDADNDEKQKKEDGEDSSNDDVDRKIPMKTTDETGNEKSDQADNGDEDKEGANAEDVEETSDGTVSALPAQPQQPQQPPGGSPRPPMYIVRPRPPGGHPNLPGNSPLGGLLLPSGIGIGSGGGGGDPSSSQSVQSALLSALTKLLLATLLTPGGLKNNPLLSWLLPRRSRERPYLPDPVQRYTFERLNDRYERDGAALERALLEMAPAADRVGHFWRRRKRRGHNNKGSRRMATKKVLEGGDNTKKEEKETASEVVGATTDKQTKQQQQQLLPNQEEEGEHRTVIVLDFCTDPNSPSARHLPTPGHTHAPAEGHAAPHDPVELLRDQISFVLEQYRDPAIRSLLGRQVEVVLRVESGGGGVQDFGVAADAVRRVRDAAAAIDASASGEIAVDESSVAGISKDGDAAALAKEDDIILTVCVDRIAASGGYMVAAQASRGRLFAAPFALVGSIGVYTERVNIHDALTRLGVRGLVLKAGKSKAPIGTIGEVSESGINAVQEDLDRVHDAFRSLVKDSRQVENGEALSSVMEGECFLGNYAQELGLVDRTITSDAYIAERVLAGDKVLRLRRYDKPKTFGGLNLPLSPLDLLLSGGASEDLFGRLKSKVRASLSAVNVADTIKLAGIIAGAFTLLKDFQLGEGERQYTKTTGPQARYTQGR